MQRMGLMLKYIIMVNLMECLPGMCLTNHTIFWSLLEMIEVLCQYILIESALFGTQMDKDAGACLDKHLRYSWSLVKSLTIFLDEGYAILMCCRICINKSNRGRCIHICLDS